MTIEIVNFTIVPRTASSGLAAAVSRYLKSVSACFPIFPIDFIGNVVQHRGMSRVLLLVSRRTAGGTS